LTNRHDLKLRADARAYLSTGHIGIDWRLARGHGTAAFEEQGYESQQRQEG
jgi:hypothetical protein